ncbi:MAG: hypothetical protein QOH06_2423 [Acidobacteriota bacterium]|nr:hypothetical protein [Acidobacteriota bacterium]
MPNINSFADLVLDQEKLLRAFEDNAEAGLGEPAARCRRHQPAPPP